MVNKHEAEAAYQALLQLKNIDGKTLKWESSPDHIWRTNLFTMNLSGDKPVIYMDDETIYVYDRNRLAISTVDSEGRKHLKYYELEGGTFKETAIYKVWMRVLYTLINEEHYSY